MNVLPSKLLRLLFLMLTSSLGGLNAYAQFASSGTYTPLQTVNSSQQQLNNNLPTAPAKPAYGPPPISIDQQNRSQNPFLHNPSAAQGEVPYYMARPGIPYYPSQEAQQVPPGTTQSTPQPRP